MGESGKPGESENRVIPVLPNKQSRNLVRNNKSRKCNEVKLAGTPVGYATLHLRLFVYIVVSIVAQSKDCGSVNVFPVKHVAKPKIVIPAQAGI